jgi:hypothetical protein
MLRQEQRHSSYFGDRFPGPRYLGRRGSSPLRHAFLDVGAQVCVKARTHLLSLALVVLKTARQPAIVTLSGSTAVLAVELFASSRSDGPKKLLVASRICAGRLENLPLGVLSTLCHADDVTGQPTSSSSLMLIRAFSTLIVARNCPRQMLRHASQGHRNCGQRAGSVRNKLARIISGSSWSCARNDRRS